MDLLGPSRYEADLDLRRGASVAFDATQDEPTTLEEIIVTSATAPGGEDSKSLPTIVNHVAAASSRCHLADLLTPCAPFEAQTKTTSARQDLN